MPSGMKSGAGSGLNAFARWSTSWRICGWLRATAAPGQEVSFAVPSGNFGNILSGHIARQMGLPIRRLVLATNENNVLEEFFRTGVYRPRPAAQTYATSSPSMDISRASNFERFVFDFVGRDPKRVAALWDEVARTGKPERRHPGEHTPLVRDAGRQYPVKRTDPVAGHQEQPVAEVVDIANLAPTNGDAGEVGLQEGSAGHGEGIRRRAGWRQPPDEL